MMAIPAPGGRELDRRIRGLRQKYEEDLALLVGIPSVSSDPGRAADVRRCAGAAAGLLRDAGASARVVPTAGHPIVHASLVTSPGNPSVAIYNHLDVQPAEPGEWRTDPFTLTISGGRYYGRGTTDDKGPALAAMVAARLAAGAGIPLNYHFLWECEEEIGSPHFPAFLRERRKDIPVDSILVSDTVWAGRGTPAIPVGLRGLLPMTLSLRTARADVHSGVAGGVARNPLLEIAGLLAAIADPETGEVKIPGFYDGIPGPAGSRDHPGGKGIPLDGIREPGDRELEEFIGASGFTREGFARDLGLTSLRRNITTATAAVRAVSTRPTFEVHGITGGYTGPGVKAIVPHRAEAKVSMRLVPGQDPARIARLARDFVRDRNPDVRVAVSRALQPYVADRSGPHAAAARTAVREAFGKEPVFTREGGSIGAVVAMDRILGVPISLLGLSLPSHGYHSVNEHFDWGQASGGIRMFVRYFSEIAAIPVRHRRNRGKG